ncbi:MAG: hypothetical protein R6U98_32205 [Pirellulaceae bacterium]
MGQLRFYSPSPERLLPHAVEWAYVAGLEAIPWRGVNSLANGILTVERAVGESGSLYIPWRLSARGERVLSTCTLMEREEPYCLARELARGTLYRARSLVAEMESRDRSIPTAIRDKLHEGLSALFSAAIGSSTDAQELAPRAIELASEAIEELAVLEVQAALDDQIAADQDVPVMLATSLRDGCVPDELTKPFMDAFHAVNISFCWRQCQPTNGPLDWSVPREQLAWSRAHGLRAVGGPLIQLDRLSLPQWTEGFGEGTYEQFESAATHYVRASVATFKDQVDLWVCAGRLNMPGTLAFSEEQKLRLAVATLEAARNAAPAIPIAIGFDQPWAEYLASEPFDLSPLHFADALVRADLGLAAVALEINLGYWPGGTQPRDLLAISRHLDRWSLLGIPLVVYLTLPSQSSEDPQTTGPARVVPRAPDQPHLPATGQDLAGDIIRLMLSKPALRAVIWNQWSDKAPHEFPHSGLLDPQGAPKPLLDSLAAIRRQYLP